MYKTQKIKAILNGLRSDDSLPPSPPPLVTIYPCFSCFERQPALAGRTCSLPGNVGKERKRKKRKAWRTRHSFPAVARRRHLWSRLLSTPGGRRSPSCRWWAGHSPPGAKGAGPQGCAREGPRQIAWRLHVYICQKQKFLKGKCWILGGSRHLWFMENIEQAPQFALFQRPRSPSQCQQCLIEHHY